MTRWKRLGSMMLVVGVLCAQQVIQDPVMLARSQRASSQEGDLPPVPRAILEPPPLPEPETHVKDTSGWRATRTARAPSSKAVKSAGPSRKAVKSAGTRRKSVKTAKARPTVGHVAKKLPRKKKH